MRRPGPISSPDTASQPACLRRRKPNQNHKDMRRKALWKREVRRQADLPLPPVEKHIFVRDHGLVECGAEGAKGLAGAAVVDAPEAD
jgi:hypothetical protein